MTGLRVHKHDVQGTLQLGQVDWLLVPNGYSKQTSTLLQKVSPNLDSKPSSFGAKDKIRRGPFGIEVCLERGKRANFLGLGNGVPICNSVPWA